MSGEKTCRCADVNAISDPRLPTVSCPRCTPTPVPSEVAETTAGEREAWTRGYNAGHGELKAAVEAELHGPGLSPKVDARIRSALADGDTVQPREVPAEPDAGEVEALAKVLADHDGCMARCAYESDRGMHYPCGGFVALPVRSLADANRAHIAAALAALLDRVRREERRAALVMPGRHATETANAARIARAASVGRGEGQ